MKKIIFFRSIVYFLINFTKWMSLTIWYDMRNSILFQMRLSQIKSVKNCKIVRKFLGPIIFHKVPKNSKLIFNKMKIFLNTFILFIKSSKNWRFQWFLNEKDPLRFDWSGPIWKFDIFDVCYMIIMWRHNLNYRPLAKKSKIH